MYILGNKRLRLTIEVDSDSDEEWDDWFLEDVFRECGIRRMWMHPMNVLRSKDGEFVRICLPLRKHPDKFYKYFRMKPATFDYILENIKNDIQKHSWRTSISPGERLAVTLRYLCYGKP